MKSTIVKNLRPEFEPVAVVWSDTIPDDAFQFKNGKFGCVLYLFAQASTRGKIAGGSRGSIICTGGRAALGFGTGFDESPEQLDLHAALFSKGLKSAENRAAYKAEMAAAPKNWRSMYEYGERRHCSPDLAKAWILHEFPRYDIVFRVRTMTISLFHYPMKAPNTFIFLQYPIPWASWTSLQFHFSRTKTQRFSWFLQSLRC